MIYREYEWYHYLEFLITGSIIGSSVPYSFFRLWNMENGYFLIGLGILLFIIFIVIPNFREMALVIPFPISILLIIVSSVDFSINTYLAIFLMILLFIYFLYDRIAYKVMFL
ncbi:hypothetical protein [Enterococcus gallinarum]|uniref:Uncharacterized protein n=1 Tax=Enterococcus gallinarum TaxID=1353 RepID=A0AAE7MPR8_ENTGA|nr:hypothetical protein [Enterococcus gallinarum]MBM6742656.1 hypothetical protein [Enterococcus gallinarum]QOG27371.1 hypothetical protein EGM181_08980 [Enterococcus gallinarum]RBT40215.1 hypothetical protein EB54_01970 [Enterococcus gallinarum]ROY71505.1 hypothetical protein EGW90_11285 [Enterococcus gallinarum]ROZ03080.1 hypothetical protein EGX16_15015 [Enterococcus gallinarum]